LIPVEVDNIKLEVANSWNELVANELKYIASRFHLLALKPKNDIEEQHKFLFRFRFVAKLFRVKFWQLHLKLKLAKMNKEQILLLADLANFIEPLNKIDLTKQLLPKIRLNGTWIYGPSDFLQNISLEEFAFADKAFINFMKSNQEKEKEQQLTRLVSCLYRPNKLFVKKDKQFKGDERKDFNSYILNDYDVKYSKISLTHKLMILLYYWGCRNSLVVHYPNVFSSGNNGKATANDLGWVGVIFELACEKIGTIDKVAESNMHFMLTYLENELIKSKNFKKPKL